LAVIETKPDNVLADLRLDDPWPELLKLTEETHHLRDGISRGEKIHTPFVVILIHEWNLWKQQVRRANICPMQCNLLMATISLLCALVAAR
jgi:hypothetical protein